MVVAAPSMEFRPTSSEERTERLDIYHINQLKHILALMATSVLQTATSAYPRPSSVSTYSIHGTMRSLPALITHHVNTV